MQESPIEASASQVETSAIVPREKTVVSTLIY